MHAQNAVHRERLTAASGLLNQSTSEACVRARIQTGAHAIDVGCGQLFALPFLSDLELRGQVGVTQS